MTILWICPTLLHPTHNGSQIRTLGILRQLNRWNEIHFVGLARRYQTTIGQHEYCSELHAVPHQPPARGSLRFAADAAVNVMSDLPLYVARYQSQRARRCVENLLERNKYDAMVLDFLLSVSNFPPSLLGEAVLFEHNVESRIFA